jgi:hypothetical protein
MMPGRILRLFSIAIAKHKGHTLTFSMSVVLPDRSRESPFVLSSVSWSASALSVADTGSGETLVFRVATIIHHALTCFPFARVDVSTGKSVPRRQSRCGPSLCGNSFRQLRIAQSVIGQARVILLRSTHNARRPGTGAEGPTFHC